MRYVHRYALLWLIAFGTSCQGPNPAGTAKDAIQSETKDTIVSYGPNTITRSLIQDKQGNVWMATFGGVFRYDGESFTNVTREVSPSRFFSVLEDSRGYLWFGSIGSGVYRYDGQSFQNFTTQEGLPNNEIGSIYEDKVGHIWFGANGGASRYDGKSFQNFIIEGDAMVEDKTGKIFSDFTRPPNEVSAIIEDQTGQFWFGTRGNTFVYDGREFSTLTHNGKLFKNVRSIIEDKKGDIWLGGADGLWRYDGRTFTNITQNFIGYIYEDKKGSIWTSSQKAGDGRWLLSRYDRNTSFSKELVVTEIESEHEGNRGMIFGMLEASDGSILLGTIDGVHRYDGNTITDFKSKEEE